ncbi:MAG: hypothetical protein FWG36_10665 [Oscillospiraceae bacterium]|nr:hypothetical protein [Oscillospiraceae bacterium]
MKNKKIISLLLALTFVLGIIPVFTPYAAYAETGGEPRAWFYIDAIGGVSLQGKDAQRKMGNHTELLLELEEETIGEDGGEPDYIPPFANYAAPVPSGGLDMSAYDVLGFRNRFNVPSGVAAEVSSAYEAAEFFMYRIMSGTGWSMWVDGVSSDRDADLWSGESVYYATFTPDVDIPWGNNGNTAGKILGEITYFIYAYFPHYFYVNGTAAGRMGTDGEWYIDTITALIAHTAASDYSDSMHWKEEYDEVGLLINRTAGVTEVFQSGAIPGDNSERYIINSGTSADKLKNAYDYVAATVKYNLDAPNSGQRAYNALVDKEAVCNGYALALSMMCLRMGLDVPYMMGFVGGVPSGAHAWNLTYNNGDMRLYDSTWGSSDIKTNGYYKVSYGHYDRPLDEYRKGQTDYRSWSEYYESYIEFVHGKKDNLNPGMIFSEMIKSSESGGDGGNNDGGGNNGTISLTDSTAPHINLATETISLPFTVAAYSIDGGKKWKKGELPTDTKWNKLFDNKKGLELWVTNAWNDKDIKEDKKVVEKKGVPSGATIIKFPKIDGRPKANQEKVAPWYGTGTETSFVLSKKGKTFSTPTSVYEYAETSDGKTASGAWTVFKDGLSIPDSGKVTWLFRSPPTVDGSKYTPGSKAFKLNAVAYVKTPNYKAPTEAKAGKPTLLKLKKGDFCLVMVDGEVKIFGSATAKTDIKIVSGSPGTNEIPGGTSVSIWKAATGKKPRSSAQELTMPTITPPTTAES